jgi:Tol biopolymer transport system component
MVAKQDAEAQAPGSIPGIRQAGRERSVRWVYLWLLFSSLLTVPWMVSNLNDLDARQASLSWLSYAAARYSDSEPAWSPDGARIAFVSDREDNSEIYVVNTDGSGQTNLTRNTAYDNNPVWSPDGARIAFASHRDGNDEIYMMNADASGQTNLTRNTAHDNNPAWSPDGARIAFYSYRDGNDEIYVMNADGSGQTNLTRNTAYDNNPVWSPDGTQIAFESISHSNFEIHVMNADGSGQTNLTNLSNSNFSPAWSPDGTRIAFQSSRSTSDGPGDIYVMDADGSGPTNLTRNAADDNSPAWSPDGARIAFVWNRDGNDEIYVMEQDGTNVRKLSAVTAAPAQAAAPPPISLAEYVAAVAWPALVHVVLLIPLWSPYLFVRRHAQQALLLAVVRVLSAVLIVGLSRGGLIGLWVVVNGGLWIFGTVWGLRQIKRGDCWLMRRRGEVSELPRPWATPKVAEPTPTATGPALAPGAIPAGQGERAATVEALRLAFRTGSPEERQRALEALKALGEIEEF